MISDIDVARELVRERDHPAWGLMYRSGAVYGAGRVLKSLLKVRGANPLRLPTEGRPVAFSFFKNERTALRDFSQTVKPVALVEFDGIHIGFVLAARGPRWVASAVREARRMFRQLPLRDNGRSLAVPILAWVLYRHVRESPRADDAGREGIISNLVHPFSLAMLFALKARGWRMTYVEHAMTPRSAMRPLPIDEARFYSAHTMGAWRNALPDLPIVLALSATGPDLVPARYALPHGPRILICVNDLDTIESMEAVITAVRPIASQVVLRLHDSDARAARIGALARSHGVRVSLATKSLIAADLAQADLVICGNSNVILDAMRSGKRLLYYWQGEADMFDYYGPVMHYRIDYARSPVDLKTRLATMISANEAS